MQLTIYFITLFLVSLCATWWIFKKVLKIAKLKNIVDNPDGRKIQSVPVPILGGVAVFFGIIVAFATAGLLFDISDMFEMICVMSIMLYLGMMDDILGLSPRLRFFVEILVVLLLIFCNDYSINNFHGLWGVESLSPWVAVPLTVFACVGIINAINLIDGVNGLSSGYCIVTCAIFGTAFMLTGDYDRASLAVLSIGALIPFFCHNVFGTKSKMFIGDSGTLVMGIIMSSFVINALKADSAIAAAVSSNFGVVPFTLAVLAIPVFDTLRVMMSRLFRGVSPFTPDRNHLHHMLYDLHFSHIGITMVEILANLFVVGCWYLSYRLGASIDVQLYVVIFLGFMITFVFNTFARAHEKKQSAIYHKMVRVGEFTHVSHTQWFLRLRAFLDRNSDVEREDVPSKN